MYDKKLIDAPNPNLLGRMALYKFVNDFKLAMGMDLQARQQAQQPGYVQTPNPYVPSQTSRSPVKSESTW
jgi:hypothetical protein